MKSQGSLRRSLFNWKGESHGSNKTHCPAYRKRENGGGSIKDRLEYSQNPDKTEDGELISSYACNPKTAAEAFLLSKKEYYKNTGRTQENDVIAYQLRQSYKSGEITPEEANKVGYETAMRFTKGKHAQIIPNSG